jgi:hypothetical protein
LLWHTQFSIVQDFVNTGQNLEACYDKAMKVYCDMDQVLVNFLAGARAALGKEFNDPCLGTDQEKWKKIQEITGFWANLEWMPGAVQLWKRIKSLDPHILSAAPPQEDAPSCPAEKTQWCWQELALQNERVHIVRRSEKRNFAVIDGEVNLLIDDHPRNCAEWCEAGGVAILHTTIPETLAELSGHGF